MHICLPDTREVRPAHGSSYVLYNVHVDGLYHCSLRYKQLLHLHQALSKKFTSSFNQLPPFPPKKLLPLSQAQVEDRRVQLEKYLQSISQDKAISNSSIFNLFLLEAQRESTRIRDGQTHLDIELVNGQKIRLQIMAHDSADAVLTSVCRALGLNDRYHAYFCLCLCGYDVVRDKLIIKRRLSFFESPFITLQMAIIQQEQLTNVLANSNNNNNNSNNGNGDSRYNSNNNNNSDNKCRCLSCSPQQLSNTSAANSATITTGVPLVGSSSGSFQAHYDQASNNYQYQTVCYQANMDVSNNSTTNNTNNWQSDDSNFKTKSTFVSHRILLRKSYWDPIHDNFILNDEQALNLLFIQTIYDMEHSLTFVDRETYCRLESLIASESKLEYIQLARTLKYYNYVHFEPCISDYPKPRTKVMISIGSRELNMRVLKLRRNSPNSLVSQQHQQLTGNNAENGQQLLYCTGSLVPSGYLQYLTKEDIVEEEYSFKVPLIRCWRLTSLETLNSDSTNNDSQQQKATTTTGGVRCRSLSLFNSVVGNVTNRSNTNNIDNHNCNFSNENRRSGEYSPGSRASLINSGTGGESLLTALSGTHQQSNGVRQQQQQQQANSASNNGTIVNSMSAPTTNNNGDENLNQVHGGDDDRIQFSQYELSFEYLISKDKLRWITISSDQAIFISISLQGVVDELVSKRDSRSFLYNGIDQPHSVSGQMMGASSAPQNRANNNNGSLTRILNQNQGSTYLYRDGNQKMLNTSTQQLIDKFGTSLGYSPTNPYSLAMNRHRSQQARASLTNNSYQNNSRGFYGNNAASASTSSSSMESRSCGWLAETSRLSGHMPIGHSANGANGGFEIMNINKKAPSPIINDAFEGVTNEDDL